MEAQFFSLVNCNASERRYGKLLLNDVVHFTIFLKWNSLRHAVVDEHIFGRVRHNQHERGRWHLRHLLRWPCIKYSATLIPCVLISIHQCCLSFKTFLFVSNSFDRGEWLQNENYFSPTRVCFLQKTAAVE